MHGVDKLRQLVLNMLEELRRTNKTKIQTPNKNVASQTRTTHLDASELENKVNHVDLLILTAQAIAAQEVGHEPKDTKILKL